MKTNCHIDIDPGILFPRPLLIPEFVSQFTSLFNRNKFITSIYINNYIHNVRSFITIKK